MYKRPLNIRGKIEWRVGSGRVGKECFHGIEAIQRGPRSIRAIEVTPIELTLGNFHWLTERAKATF